MVVSTEINLPALARKTKIRYFLLIILDNKYSARVASIDVAVTPETGINIVTKKNDHLLLTPTTRS